MFDAAAKLTSDTGSDVLTAPNLFKAILAAPTPVIARVLGSAVDQTLAPDERITLLVKHGRDLIRETREAALPSSPSSPECKAFLQGLIQGKGKTILLVTQRVEAVDSLVMGAARSIAMREADKRLWGRRIFDVRQKQGRQRGLEKELLQALIGEVSCTPSVILVIPAIAAGPANGESESQLVWLKETLKRAPAQCVCQVSPETYQESIARDATWKGITRVMWLHAAEQDEIPWQL